MMDKLFDWLEGLPRFGVLRYNLYRMWLLAQGFVPEYRDLEVFFIAGSKGKGTTATALASILDQAGVPTGLVTSPHLFSVTERIALGGTCIGEEVLARLLAQVRADLPALPEEYGPWLYGEVLLVAALLWFRERGARALVLEAGLGGRLDAGNFFRRPLATCITNVTLEHRGILGSTLEEIAGEKAGIIKPGTPLVTAAQEEALAVVKKRARLLAAPVWAYPADFYWREEGRGARLVLPGMELWLERKAATPAEKIDWALAARLAAFHPRVDPRAIGRGLALVPRLPGRFEVVPGEPVFVLDVAHTPEAVANLLSALEEHFPGQRIAFVAGFLADKEGKVMLGLMMAGDRPVYHAPLRHPRSLLWQDCPLGIPVPSVREGIKRAGARASVVCVTGSFAAVKEAGEYLGRAPSAAGYCH